MKNKHSCCEESEPSCCLTEEKEHGKGLPHEKVRHEIGKGTAARSLRMFYPSIVSLILLLSAIALREWFVQGWFSGWIMIIWYISAYIPVGLPVIKEAIRSIGKGDVFSEFLLMSIATIGAFSIGEYSEGVTVMLFYSIGEIFQILSVSRAKSSIKSLLDQRPDEVTILQNNKQQVVKAEIVMIGDTILLKPGEKLGLDSELLSESGSFNTAALTGESKPQTKKKGETVLAGMINMNMATQVKVTAKYTDSKLSKILELVQSATKHKAPTEVFIRNFAKIYTPVVVFLAITICLLPALFVKDYQFQEWLYRALAFLVISCPCALVISVPLGYFGGIGAAGRNGILFKGSDFLDTIASIQNVVMDKTGTITKGVFNVQEVVFKPEFNKIEILKIVNALESQSIHPIASAIHNYVGEVDNTIIVNEVEEIAGYGLRAIVDNKEIIIGNVKMMDKFDIRHDMSFLKAVFTVIAIAYDKEFIGYITIADSVKHDAQTAINRLKKMGVTITILSGDKSTVVSYIADMLGIQKAYGDLLPEDKVHKVREIKSLKQTVAFVGDGVNDAPVIALSDVGIAMGGLGSDMTIEVADVVIQNDALSKIPMAINIGKQTRRIVWQNIILAFTVKTIVLLLSAGGMATMWEAVFADVGVALLAILNAVRIQRMSF